MTAVALRASRALADALACVVCRKRQSDRRCHVCRRYICGPCAVAVDCLSERCEKCARLMWRQ